jgi:ABC-type multidrug transport system ATPase subunit
MSDPSLIFLEEPTRDVDEPTADFIIQLLRDLALQENRTVISCISKVTDKQYEMLDKLMIIVD